VAGDDRTIDLFHEAMAGLPSGVTVITARRSDGRPCGLAATSASSFSADPPSLLVSVSHASRCHAAITESAAFGLHVLAADQEPLARVFAGRGEDKFDGVEWDWDGEVPRLAGVIAYLRCGRSAVFAHHDHSVVVGDIEAGATGSGEPLLYARRRMDWLLRLGE
jgi:flavin reductase ActVB